MAMLHWNFYSQALGIAASADIILPQDAIERAKNCPRSICYTA